MNFFLEGKELRLITVIALFNAISIPFILMVNSWPTHAVVDSGTFTKENSQEIAFNYSEYSRRGFSVYLDFNIKDGTIDWQIIDPKGKIILKGYAVNKNGKLNNLITYPANYKAGFCIIKPLNIPGKYTLSIKHSGAVGEYTARWEDTPIPLI